MSSVNFAIPDFCSLVPNVPAVTGNFLAKLHWKRHRAASCSFTMISFANINKQYGKQLLFVDASFQLNPGEKVGLVGPNGAGKTTPFLEIDDRRNVGTNFGKSTISGIGNAGA